MGGFLSVLGALAGLLFTAFCVGLGTGGLMIYLFNMPDNQTSFICCMVFGVVFCIALCVIWAVKKKRNFFGAIYDVGYLLGCSIMLIFGVIVSGIIVGMIIGYLFSIEDEMTCYIYGIVIVAVIGVIALIKTKIDDVKRRNTPTYTRPSSPSGGYGYSGDSFSASDYVFKNCRGQITGVSLQADLDKIKNDPTLTTAQKEQATKEYEWRVGANNLSNPSHPWY